jgi:hypothetical protein
MIAAAACWLMSLSSLLAAEAETLILDFAWLENGPVASGLVCQIGDSSITFSGILSWYADNPLYYTESRGLGFGDNPAHWYTNTNADHGLNNGNAIQFSTGAISADVTNIILNISSDGGSYALFGSNQAGTNGQWLASGGAGAMDITDYARSYSYLFVVSQTGNVWIQSMELVMPAHSPEPSDCYLLITGIAVLTAVQYGKNKANRKDKGGNYEK